MATAWTFSMKPVRELLFRYDVGLDWIDPFAGRFSPAEYTNDHNPERNAKYHLDVMDFAVVAKELRGERGYKGCLFDPPYSSRQVSEHYKQMGRKATQQDTTMQFVSDARKAFAPLVDQYVISFGWNSTGFGKNLGFECIEIMLVQHGGLKNDTIVTVERRK